MGNNFIEQLDSVILDCNGKVSAGRLKYLKKNHPTLYSELLKLTKSWPSTASLMERYYAIKCNLSTPPKCMCGELLKYNNRKKRYNRVCNISCSEGAKLASRKREETCLERYGVVHNSKIESVRRKRENTFLEKYGVTTPLKSSDIRQKAVETLKKNHGVESPMHSIKIKEKQRKTTQERYGVDNVSKLEEVRKKVKNTVHQRYGVDYVTQDSNIKEKVKNTNLERYGVENVFSSEEVKRKIREINSSKYGSPSYMQSHIDPRILAVLNNLEIFSTWIEALHYDLEIPITIIAENIGVAPRTLFSRMEGLEIERLRFSRSYLEEEVLQWIYTLGIEKSSITLNDRYLLFPKEVDIVIPEKKLAIELCGLFWHSFDRTESKEERYYHQNKYLKLKDLGYQLLTIFENEWNNQQEIVKGIIKTKLKLNKSRVYARDLTCREVEDVSQVREFLSTYHLQGYIPSTYSVGLYEGDSLISIMTFGRSRYNKEFEWEIYRFCSKTGFSIVGGASKMFSKFLKEMNPKSVITYCDLRYGSGEVYSRIGFSEVQASKPNFYYYNGSTRESTLYSRISFQKHKLSEKLYFFDPNLTEAENMFENGYRRIWDCGNSVFHYIP
jgi:G:T-mismatch repair DNA endonuclease (very short patch repair protein)/viroplasmin and RNaseH domain-containing protein